MSINWISVILLAVFLLPLVYGLLRLLTDTRISEAFDTFLSAAAFALSAGLSVLITEGVFTAAGDTGSIPLLQQLPVLAAAVAGKDMLAYLLVLVLSLFFFNALLRLLLLPVRKKLVQPLSLFLGRRLASSARVAHRLVSAAWQLPRALLLVLLFSLVFYAYAALSGGSPLGDYIGSSRAYRLVETRAIQPLLSSPAVRSIPPLIDTMVNRTVAGLSPEGRRLLFRVYINGSTVADAVRSTPDIDNIAIDLVDTETDDYKKAEILYHWVCAQISYDTEKAEQVAVDAFSVTSGAAVAYADRTGVCFDMACLYVSMCRAVDVPVRLVTGQGCGGSSWEDHSWNQIYDGKEARWVNVDTTFGGSGADYFDRDGFEKDHRGDTLQGEW